MNVFLIGFRCTGKTTVGRILSESLGLRFIDTDRQFVAEAGQSIDSAVNTHGWRHFRQWEANILAQVCTGEGQVVATGGGVILNPDNVAGMNRSGAVVWLCASPETIVRRMTGDDDSQISRPSLTGKAPSVEVIEVLSQRTPLYRQAADIEVMTDERSQGMIADEIVQALGAFKKQSLNIGLKRGEGAGKNE